MTDNLVNSEVVLLERSQHTDAVELLATAFNQDPLFRYYCSEDDAIRLKSLRWFMNLMLNYSHPINHNYATAGDLKGVAVWLPPGEFPTSQWRLLQLGFYAIPFKVRLSRLRQALKQFDVMEEHHKHDMPQPHWFLYLLGVAPAYQNQGIGSLLLQPMLQQADADGLPCYLETSTERGVRFYQRHGFEIIRTVQLTEDTPPFWTLARSPQPI